MTYSILSGPAVAVFNARVVVSNLNFELKFYRGLKSCEKAWLAMEVGFMLLIHVTPYLCWVGESL